MTMTTKELKKRDAKRDLGVELLESVHQMKAGRATRLYVFMTPALGAK